MRIRELAKRLIVEGAPDRALVLLDKAEALLDWEAFDRHAAATGRASLLNERGNALRARLDAESALIEYEEALLRLEGLGHDDDVRSVRLNRARALRDAGYLSRAISEMRVLLANAEGRARFDALFALGLAYQRNGQYHDAQPVLDEAWELVRAEPMDDQIARFMIARQANARALGHAEDATQLIDAVAASPFVSARQRLLTIAGGSITALRAAGPESDLGATTRRMARGFGLPELARRDAEFALLWADAARLAGDGELARETIDAALGELRQPVLGIHAAAVAAEMAIDDADWDSARGYVERASELTTALFGVASSGSTTVTLADTLSDLRALGVRLVTAPAGEEHDRLLSAVADLGSSLQLSATIAGEHLPSRRERSAPAGNTVQVLQWLDGGDVQLPLLAIASEDGTQVRRGRPVPTELVEGLGARIAGRVGRTTAFDSADVLESIPRFRAFQEKLATALAELPIDSASPLTVVPSGRMAGIPIHAALPHHDVAYCPSLAIAVALAHRAAARPHQQDAIGEIRCWCYGEQRALIDALCEGGEALRTICTQHRVPYRLASETAATRAAVAKLVDVSTWVKLSCHGVDKPSFALILADGQHAPPSLSEVLERPETGARYLFDWNEVAGIRSRCRAVLSSACTSGSVGATTGGEQTGLARAFLMSGVLAFVAPLWPVAGGPGQVFVNDLLERCLAEPGVPLATQLARTRAALRQAAPPRVVDSFVLHGFAGPINPITKEEP